VKVDRPTFVVTLRPEPRVEPIRALRRLLKVLLREYGMKCTSVDLIDGKEEEPSQ
jgi:hypothetical protein